jgi:hypothetical protein
LFFRVVICVVTFEVRIIWPLQFIYVQVEVCPNNMGGGYGFLGKTRIQRVREKGFVQLPFNFIEEALR